MFVSKVMLDQLAYEMEKNNREMVVMLLSDLRIDAKNVQGTHAATQPPQNCNLNQRYWLDCAWNEMKTNYNGIPHTFVNTNWGVPAGLAAVDAKNIAILLRDIGGFGTKARVSVRNGQEYLILTGYPGLRRKLKGTRYGVRNAQLLELGIGKYGIRGSSIQGFKISCWVAVGIEVAEWAFNDEAVLTDLFGGIGVELVKAGIATTVGYAAGVFAGTLITAAAAPVAAGAIFVFVVGYGLNVIDNHYGIKNAVKASLRHAVTHFENIQAQVTKIDVDEIKEEVEQSIADMAAQTAEYLYDEAKRWAIRKIQPGELRFPRLPSGGNLPMLNNFKIPKI